MDKINNIGLTRELTSCYDFQGFTEQEVWSRIAQKINIIIEHFNYIDKKVDNEKENNKTKFDYLLGEGLTEQVAKALLEKIKDGTLGELINKSLLVEINNKVDTYKSETDSNINEYKIETNTSVEEFKTETTNKINNFKNEFNSDIEALENKTEVNTFINSINNAISSGTSSLSTDNFDINNSGIIAKNGTITVKNGSGENIFYKDSDGNMKFIGIAELINTLLINGKNGIAKIALRSNDGLECNITTGNEKSLKVYAPNGIYLGGYKVVIEDKENKWKMWTVDGGSEKAIYFDSVNGKIYSEGLPLTLSALGGRVQTETNFYVRGSCNPMYNSKGGMDLGSENLRWHTVYCVNAINTSDKNYKKNISYLDDKIATVFRNRIEENKYYNFIKDNLKIAEYDYNRNDNTERVGDHQIGFIAQDIIDTEVGSKFCYEMSEGLGFSASGYTSVVAKALQEAIKKIEVLEEKIEKLESYHL